jgi:transcriptional regulator with XRE-family HTH domain
MNLVDSIPMAMPRNHIKLWIAENGSSQAKLAKAAHVTQQAIGQFIAGRTDRLKTLPELAEYMGVSTDWLLRGADPTTDKGISPRPPFGQDNGGADDKGANAMGDAKAKLLKLIIDMTDEAAAGLLTFIEERDGLSRPTKRGRTS